MTSTGDRLAALILAAGYSSRMGDFKPLLPLGRSLVIERAVNSFLQAGVQDVRVVVGHNAAALEPTLGRLGARAIFNANYEAGMFSSVVAGVRSLEAGTAGFFVLPVDTPLVKPRTVRTLSQVFQATQARILYPRFLQRRGHPPLISACYIQEILTWKRLGGLRMLLSEHQDASLDVEVADQGILLDVDTPEDYQAALAYADREAFPTAQECHVLLSQLQVATPVLAHSRRVAELACRLAGLLNRAGYSLNLDLLTAAGLLHDLAKGQADHAHRAADYLVEWGYSQVADVVASHMDLRLEPGHPLNEAQILYLADKLVQGSRVVPLRGRLESCSERFAGQPEALEAARRRIGDALTIQKRVKAAIATRLTPPVSGLQ
jgi:molybdenum cofactor cytidylyltransferase